MGGNDNLIKVVVFSLVLATLLYPGLEKLYLYRQTYILEDLVMAPLSFLGKDQTILANDDKFTRYETKYKNLDFVRGDNLFIGIKNEFKFHERWINLTEEKQRVFNERIYILYDLYQKISNNYYSSVIYGPFSDESDLVRLYYALQMTEDPSKSGLSNLDNYCELFLPTTEHRCTLCKGLIRVFFRENETCNYFMPKILDYYSKNFYKICSLNELTANIQVRETMAGNGFFILDKCKNGGTLLSDYNNKDFRLNDYLNIFYLSLLVATLVLFKFKRKLSVYGLLLLIILLLPLNILNNNFVSDYALNETSYAYTNKSLLDDQRFPQNIKAQEILHDASYYAPAEIGELEQKDLIDAGRYNNNIN